MNQRGSSSARCNDEEPTNDTIGYSGGIFGDSDFTMPRQGPPPGPDDNGPDSGVPNGAIFARIR